MMDAKILNEIKVRKILDSEDIPYDLLLDADPSMEVISTYLGLSEIYIALLKNKIIGTFVLYPVGHEILEIKNIAVEEGLQRKGIGKLLLKNATEIARARGIKKLDIATSNASFEALSLYQKEGFDMDLIKKNYITENYPKLLFDNGIQCRHMIVLTKYL
ncbi:MAG TPA: GNAT family N-acetyltransferase [Puia sp.]|nr:GNAT family N-acetyltransferase [Puia sp.]